MGAVVKHRDNLDNVLTWRTMNLNLLYWEDSVANLGPIDHDVVTADAAVASIGCIPIFPPAAIFSGAADVDAVSGLTWTQIHLLGCTFVMVVTLVEAASADPVTVGEVEEETFVKVSIIPARAGL